MIIIVDANIIFSAVIKPSSTIGKIIFSENEAMLVAPRFLKDEIEEHKKKIIKITGKTEQEVAFVILSAFNKITFYSEEIIPANQIDTAINLVADIDPDDFIYVAFALFFNAKLWSGDKVLSQGLIAKGVTITATTFEVATAILK